LTASPSARLYCCHAPRRRSSPLHTRAFPDVLHPLHLASCSGIVACRLFSLAAVVATLVAAIAAAIAAAVTLVAANCCGGGGGGDCSCGCGCTFGCACGRLCCYSCRCCCRCCVFSCCCCCFCCYCCSCCCWCAAYTAILSTTPATTPPKCHYEFVLRILGVLSAQDLIKRRDQHMGMSREARVDETKRK